MTSCARVWRDHSLTIVLAGIALGCFGAALMQGETISLGDLGHDALSGVLIFLFSGAFREKNRPEE